jgi:hypothetical protein
MKLESFEDTLTGAKEIKARYHKLQMVIAAVKKIGYQAVEAMSAGSVLKWREGFLG